ncbi:hypothetical protein VNO78_22315 [Psophocarpus tetragonolobus]|uniref:Protein kinase domain-containing protein n=1 Tax=Psophocarpus tetragonolobus TaxID=3891 RepID=A0AAN9SDK4_PSOTE
MRSSKVHSLFGVLVLVLVLVLVRCCNGQTARQENNTGYTCRGRSTCEAYAFYRAASPNLLDLGAIGDLFEVSRRMIARPSNISNPSTALVPDQPLLVPLTCSCNPVNASLGSLSYANISYTIKSGDTFFLVSTIAFQNLTTYPSVQAVNPTLVPTKLSIGQDLIFPIFCKCPDNTTAPTPTNTNYSYIISYVVQPSDTLSSIASTFAADQQAIIHFNGDTLHLYDTIFIPVTRLPSLSQPALAPSAPPPGNGTTLSGNDNHTDRTGTVRGLGIGLGIVGLLLILVSGFLVSRIREAARLRVERDEEEGGQRKQVFSERKALDLNLMANVSDCLDKYRVFAIDELLEATHGFHHTSSIQGSVYKGLIDGHLFAIKKMHWNAYEELKILQKVNHGNLVKLEGFCIDPEEANCYLVYEYVENGSLYSWLHEDKNEKLNWKTRLRIAIDIANGLQYIHEHTRPRVVHKDIKSSNILLDSNMRAKIANFGLAKSGINAITMHIVGTQGYIAPEYLADGVVSTKMDVFSFGVVLLELISGKEAIDEEGNLLWASAIKTFDVDNEQEKTTRLKEWLDKDILRETCSMESLVGVLTIAIACLHRDQRKRPSIMDIVYALNKSEEMGFEISDDGFGSPRVMASFSSLLFIFISVSIFHQFSAMWTLRRASLRLSKSQGLGLNVGATRVSCVKLVPPVCVQSEAGITQSREITSGRFLTADAFCGTGCASVKFASGSRQLSSQAGASSSKENDDDDLEAGLSELDMHGSNDESDADLSHSDEDGGKPHHDLELSDAEIDPTKKKSQGRWTQSELFKAILQAPGLSVDSALDKWAEQGKELNRKEISSSLRNLRQRKMYGRALQLFQWLESNKKLEFLESDYASQLDLIAKLRGPPKAEKYIESVPESFRGELLYRTLLANYVSLNNLTAAEKIFNKMKDLDLPLTTFACNQLLLLYKKIDKKKIADVLLLMEKENVKPSIFTYRILIDSKGQSNDIAGMEQVFETMKAEGIEPDFNVHALLARHYISAGLKEKAEAILKDIEGENLEENSWVCSTLIRLYANLGKGDEVERIWKYCESTKIRLDDCLGAIEAWGKLKEIEKAEAVFEMASKRYKLNAKNYSVLLKVYANNKMLNKGKDLVKRMADNGLEIGPLTWDALVKLYIQAGEVEKADSVLQKAVQKNRLQPMFSTFMAILDQYAKRGDVHNSEKIFLRMRQAGYTNRISQFQTLIQAYINAKVPAYGIRERMKADNLFPNRNLANQLALVDAFRTTAVSDLLD